MGEVVEVGDFYDPWDPKVTCILVTQEDLDWGRLVNGEFAARWRRVLAGEPARWVWGDWCKGDTLLAYERMDAAFQLFKHETLLDAYNSRNWDLLVEAREIEPGSYFPKWLR